MDVEYSREPGSAHMILSTYKDACGYKDRMVESNKINALLDFSKSKMGSKYQCWYDISGKNSLKGFFMREGITLDTLSSCLGAVNEAFSEIRKFLLEPKDVALSEESVFLDFDGFRWRAYFAYLPEETGGFSEGMEEIAEFLIENVDHEDEVVTKACYQIYEKTSQGETTISDLIEIINSFEIREPEPVEEIDYGDKLDEYEPEDDNLFADEKPKKKSIFSFLFPKKGKEKEKAEIKEFFEEYDEEDLVVNEYMESATTVLMPQDTPLFCKLIYEGKGNKTDIRIEKTPFRIGSKETVNDAVIKEGVISRSHARITMENDNYYIEDLESKNGTFVNGQILDFNKRLKLNVGDRISFANIGYRFE